MTNDPRDRLRHHVTGAIERGEAEPIREVRAMTLDEMLLQSLACAKIALDSGATGEAKDYIHQAQAEAETLRKERATTVRAIQDARDVLARLAP